jgi:hypothetical protein
MLLRSLIKVVVDDDVSWKIPVHSDRRIKHLEYYDIHGKLSTPDSQLIERN